MKKKQIGFSLAAILIALVLVSIVGVAGWWVYKSNKKNDEHVSVKFYDPTALMVATYSGGWCSNGPCNHPTYSLYEDGAFEGHTKLSSSELAQLKKIITDTDFSKYSPKLNPLCNSSSDGRDQVLIFPKKYGNRTFTPCQLDTQGNDAAFSYINGVIESHYIQ